jgi:hypothetical protein
VLLRYGIWNSDIQNLLLPSGSQPAGNQVPVMKPSLSMLGELANMMEAVAKQIMREGDEALGNELMAMQNKLNRRRLKKQQDLQAASEELLGAQIMGQM